MAEMVLEVFRVVEEQYPFSPAFRDDWRSLHHSSSGANNFNRLSWLEAAWLNGAAPGDAARPLRFVDASGRTRAMCFHLETTVNRLWGPTRVWKNLGFNVHRMPPVLAASVKDMAAALAALFRQNKGRVDSYSLYSLDAMGTWLREINQLLAEEGLALQLDKFQDLPRIVLGDNWVDYQINRSGKFWKNLRAQLRKLEADHGPVRFERIRDRQGFAEADPAAVFEEISSLCSGNRSRRSDQIDLSSTVDQLCQFFSTNIRLNQGEGVEINLLRAAGRLIAFDLNLVEDGRVYALLGAFDREFSAYGPGTLLLAHWLEDSHQREDRIIEFGPALSGRRERWATEYATSYQLRHYGQPGKFKTVSLLRRVKTSAPAAFARKIARRDWTNLPLPGWLFQLQAYYVFEIPLVEGGKSKVAHLRLSRLTVKDLPALAHCREMADLQAGMTELENRLNKGSLAFGAWSGERLIGYCFVRQGGSVRTDAWDKFELKLPMEAAYGYDSFIHPNFRGTGLFRVLVGFACRELIELGVRRLYATVNTENSPSIRARTKLGGFIIETVRYRCCLGLVNYRVSGNGGAYSKWTLYRCGRFFSLAAV